MVGMDVRTGLLFGLAARVDAADWLTLADTNTAVGDDSKPSATTTVVSSISDHQTCVSHCRSQANCTVWSWSPNSKNCYLRAVGYLSSEHRDGYWGGCRTSEVEGCIQIPDNASCPAAIPMPSHGPAPLPPRASKNVSVMVNVKLADQLPAMASPFRGVGVTMDFWPPSKDKWSVSATGGCGALDLDLTQVDLRYLAAQLEGSLLRLGGSPVDSLLYETPETPDACSDAEVNKTRPAATGGYYCPNWDQVDFSKSSGAHCLKSSRWADINKFALDAGLLVAFGLNACWLRPDAAGELDWTYVEAMLKQTAKLAAQNESAVWAWEFGNELYSSGVHADRYGADVKELMKRSAAAWSAAEQAAGLPHGSLSRPRFLGPDNGLGYMSQVYAQDLLAAAEGAVHALTFHDYGNPCSGHAEPGLALNASCVDERVRLALSSYGNATASFGAELWLGEGAFHASSGVRGLTDTFRSSLWYAHTLGALFSSDVKLFARQTLVGGDYGLVNRTTAAPTPDYYVLLLWRRLIGSRPIGLDASGLDAAPGLRLYSFAGRDHGYVLVAVNEHVELGAQLHLGEDFVDVYQLAADASSNRVHFNGLFGGSELLYRNGGGGLPALEPHRVAASELYAAPCSVTFMHVHHDTSLVV